MLSLVAKASDSVDSVDKWYANQMKVSINEAVKRSKIMNKAIKVAQEFKNERYSFSTLVIRHQPKFEIVYRVKRFKHCENKKHSSDKRCSLPKRIKSRLNEENILQSSRLLFVKYALADQKYFQDKASYYLHKFAKGNWSSSGWDHNSQTIVLGIVNPKKFYRNLADANIELPPFISVIQHKLYQ